MQNCFVKTAKNTVVIETVYDGEFKKWVKKQTDRQQNWMTDTGFNGEKTAICLIPDAKSHLKKIVFYMSGEKQKGIYDWAKLPGLLPELTGRIYEFSGLGRDDLKNAVMGWGLAEYRFDRYKTSKKIKPKQLLWPDVDLMSVDQSLSASHLVRDLINTPARDLGPEQLAAAAVDLCNRHKAKCDILVGDQLLQNNYPAIHVVGGGANRAPRLIDMKWGYGNNPKLTLVGKGVCFDTGGLDLKSAAHMKLMKKDMGGAAHVLGLASMIMAAGLPVRLRVLIPAVENSVSANAYRPSDIIPSRKGLNIEVNNTDAEGRIVLADALAAASEDNPDLIIDFATLTGAARVALGTDLPALFSNNDNVQNSIVSISKQINDALWPLPLWAGYDGQVDGQIGDVDNAPEGGYAGAITAALFLKRFVERTIDWVHIDVMAWNLKTTPGRPQGGEAMGMRGVFAYIKDRYAK